MRLCFITVTLLSTLLIVHVQAQDKERPKELTLSNFTQGWLTPWQEPEEGPNQSPCFRLLKIPATVFEREVRMNYSFTNNEEDGKLDEHEWELEFEMPVSRRLLIEVEPKILYVLPEEEDNHSGLGDTSFIARIMLMETLDTTLLSVFGVTFPTGDEDRELGGGKTLLSPGLGFWKDLGGCFALHSFFGADIPVGGTTHADPDLTVTYGAALTKTLTPKDMPFLGDFTLFVELNGGSDVGSSRDHTLVSILPGIRWNLGHEFWLMPGVELPLIQRDELDERVRFSILKDF
ncbi:MAG: transporter [Candidatus Brocadiales bacterium]|nr:transporter [Candidatus Brocadiales bacterium]